MTVWPGPRRLRRPQRRRDRRGRPFTLCDGAAPVRHELYLAHATHLALAGASAVELTVDLAADGDRPLATVWEYWDGTAWRAFKALRDEDLPGDSLDGTHGLTRSGTLRLATDCAESAPRTIGGWESLWIRGRVAVPLPPEPGRRLPVLDRVGIRTVIDRRLPAQGCQRGLQPETAFADVRRIDMTKPFQPLGATPGPESSFYLTHAEAFSKPGAEVTICLRRPFTPQESNDIELAKYEAGVNAARSLVEQIRTLMGNLEAVLKALTDPATGELRADGTPLFDTRPGGTADADLYLDDFWNDITGRMQAALDGAERCAGPVQSIQILTASQLGTLAWYDTFLPVVSEPFKGGVAEVGMEVMRWTAIVALVAGAEVVVGVADAIAALATPDQARLDELEALRAVLNTLGNARTDILNGDIGQKIAAAGTIIGSLPALSGAYVAVVNNLGAWPTTIYLQTRPAFIQTARDRYADMRGRIDRARGAILGAIGSATALDALLADLSPITLAAAAGVTKPLLPLPTLAWEYWNGAGWRRLRNVTSVDEHGAAAMGPRHFRHGSGRVSFTVPDDWEPNTVNAERARWLRVRIVKGTFAIVKHVCWFDAQSKSINFMPIIEARPPLIDRFFLGYLWAATPATPEHCLTLNDFEWADRTRDAGWPGGGFEPFTPVGDTTPTLYMGFDGRLPADLLGLWLGCDEAAAGEAAPRLQWECWDGQRWAAVTADDETRDLARPGIAFVLSPRHRAPRAPRRRARRGARDRAGRRPRGGALHRGHPAPAAPGSPERGRRRRSGRRRHRAHGGPAGARVCGRDGRAGSPGPLRHAAIVAARTHARGRRAAPRANRRHRAQRDLGEPGRDGRGRADRLLDRRAGAGAFPRAHARAPGRGDRGARARRPARARRLRRRSSRSWPRKASPRTSCARSSIARRVASPRCGCPGVSGRTCCSPGPPTGTTRSSAAALACSSATASAGASRRPDRQPACAPVSLRRRVGRQHPGRGDLSRPERRARAGCAQRPRRRRRRGRGGHRPRDRARPAHHAQPPPGRSRWRITWRSRTRRRPQSRWRGRCRAIPAAAPFPAG